MATVAGDGGDKEEEEDGEEEETNVVGHWCGVNAFGREWGL